MRDPYVVKIMGVEFVSLMDSLASSFCDNRSTGAGSLKLFSSFPRSSHVICESSADIYLPPQLLYDRKCY